MKKLVAIALGMVMGASVWSQGVLDFDNITGLTTKISEVGGSPFLDGSAYKVDLYYGAVGANPNTFTSLGIAINFLSGGFAGYFSGGSQAIPGFAAGSTVAVQPRAWNASAGATWLAASQNPLGHVSPDTAPTVNVTLVSATGNPTPPIPPKLVGYVGHSLVPVPEPSTILLGLAGISGLLFLRRKMA